MDLTTPVIGTDGVEGVVHRIIQAHKNSMEEVAMNESTKELILRIIAVVRDLNSKVDYIYNDGDNESYYRINMKLDNLERAIRDVMVRE